MAIDESLIPPDDLLFDGTSSRGGFLQGGPGFLWNLLVARARLGPGHAVLDMGSGNGKHARVLTQYLKADEGGRYVGFDIVREGVEWCQGAYAPYANFRFDLAELRSDWYNQNARASADKYVFPYEDASFDVAFASSLFTHLEPGATANYLRNVERVLKPGGRLLMTCFLVNKHNGGRHAQAVQGREFSRVSNVHYTIDRAHPSRGVAYDEDALRAMIARSGLIVAEIAFGTWANGLDAMAALQDMILAVKR